MRKILAIILSAVVAIGCVGCASQVPPNNQETPNEENAPSSSSPASAAPSSSPTEPVTLSFFTGKVETVDLINEIIAEYNSQSNGITVEQEYQNDASNIIKIKFASGEAPDVLTTYEQEYVDQGKYLDISNRNEWWDRLIPSMKESCIDLASGKQYRVCTNMTMAGFFYNKEIYEELNLKVASTWEEFESNLEAIKAAHPDVDPWFIFGSEAWHLGHLIEFLPHGYIKAKYGATEAKRAFLDNNKEILSFGDPNGAMATFAKNLVNIKEKGLINADVLTATSDNCVDAFVTGKAAMLSNGMWVLSGILEKNPDMADKIGFAPYPSFMADGEAVVLVAEDSGYSISAGNATEDEAIDFLNFLFKSENQKKYSESLGSPSAFKDVDAKWAPDSIVEGVDQAVASATNIGYTNEKPSGFSGDDAGRLLQNLLAGTYSPEEFATEYERAWDAGF